MTCPTLLSESLSGEIVSLKTAPLLAFDESCECDWFRNFTIPHSLFYKLIHLNLNLPVFVQKTFNYNRKFKYSWAGFRSCGSREINSDGNEIVIEFCLHDHVIHRYNETTRNRTLLIFTWHDNRNTHFDIKLGNIGRSLCYNCVQ